MAVEENDLIVGPLTPANGVSVISWDFLVENAGWLKVYKSGSETPLVLGTDYTVSGIGTDSGSITLTTAANGTDVYAVYLEVPQERTSDLQFRGGFQSEPFNVELDRVWLAIQGIATRVGRTLRVGRTSATVGSLTDLTDAARAGRLLKFDATGAALETGATLPDIEVVSGLADEIETLGAIAADVTTVAEVAADVTTVAGVSADVPTVAGIEAEVVTVAGLETAIGTVNANAADIATVAANVTDVTNFADVYLGPAATAPTTRTDGSALQTGDLYFNTGLARLFIWSAGAWSAAAFEISGALIAVNNLADLADVPAARANLGLVPGTDVQAYDADLTSLVTKLGTGGLIDAPILNGDVTGTALASTAEAEAGTLNTRLMTPVRVKEAVAAHELFCDKLAVTTTGTAAVYDFLFDPAKYSMVKLVLASILSNGDDVRLTAQFTTDGGSTFQSAGYRYVTHMLEATAATVAADNSASLIQLLGTAGAGGASNEDDGVSGEICIYPGAEVGDQTRLISNLTYTDNGALVRGARCHALFVDTVTPANTSLVNGIRLDWTGGSFRNGQNMYFYGVRR